MCAGGPPPTQTTERIRACFDDSVRRLDAVQVRYNLDDIRREFPNARSATLCVQGEAVAGYVRG